MNTTDSKFADSFLEEYTTLLRAGGGRVTHARLATARCIAQSASPVSASDILMYLEENGDEEGVDPASVYRSLQNMQELGLVHQIPPGNKFIACRQPACCMAKSSHRHATLLCVDCRRCEEIELPMQSVRPLIKALQRDYDFELSSHCLQLEGVCRNCQS